MQSIDCKESYCIGSMFQKQQPHKGHFISLGDVRCAVYLADLVTFENIAGMMGPHSEDMQSGALHGPTFRGPPTRDLARHSPGPTRKPSTQAWHRPGIGPAQLVRPNSGPAPAVPPVCLRFAPAFSDIAHKATKVFQNSSYQSYHDA